MKKLLYFYRLMRSEAPLLRFEILRRIGRIVFPEYRFQWPQLSWWHNTDFNDYLNKFKEINGMNTDRRWMITQLMRLVENIPGDTAECGVYKGSSSYLICRINASNTLHKKTHHMFDSFEGISNPTIEDGKHWKKGDLSTAEDVVSNNLVQLDNFRIYKGWIPNKFQEIETLRFSFVHIDVDLYQPTYDSIAFFYPRMNNDGILVCDDYGFTSCPGATKAVDQFLFDKPEKMISMSGGGGLMIKNVITAG